jgi:hypothetical protein
MLGQRRWATWEILPGLFLRLLRDGQDGSYKGNRKGYTSREEVGQGNSSVDRRDSITRRERRPLALAVLDWKEGRGDCR